MKDYYTPRGSIHVNSNSWHTQFTGEVIKMFPWAEKGNGGTRAEGSGLHLCGGGSQTQDWTCQVARLTAHITIHEVNFNNLTKSITGLGSWSDKKKSTAEDSLSLPHLLEFTHKEDSRLARNHK